MNPKTLLGIGAAAYLLSRRKKEAPQEKKKSNSARVQKIFEDQEIEPSEKRKLRKIWRNWNRLVNMSSFEIREFLDSEDGKEAGLTRKEAKDKGIRSGRDSAKALIRMIPQGRTFRSAMRNWSERDWEWADHQVRFIKRMKNIKGGLLNKDGSMSRKTKALMIWGHDPRR